MYTALLMSLSVAVIAAARRESWSANWMPWIVAGVAVVAYVGGQYLDGVEPALTREYWGGFVVAITAQQGLHRIVKNTSWYQALEAAGNPRGLAGQPRVGDEGW